MGPQRGRRGGLTTPIHTVASFPLYICIGVRIFWDSLLMIPYAIPWFYQYDSENFLILVNVSFVNIVRLHFSAMIYLG
jgi:hypothetical protein